MRLRVRSRCIRVLAMVLLSCGAGSVSGQGFEKLVLRPHPAARDDARDELMAFALRQRASLPSHSRRISMQTAARHVSRPRLRGTLAPPMLRRLMWTGLYASLAAAATMAARKAASGIWRVATGEEPPVKK